MAGKRNGFERPYDLLQIVSWFLFPAFVVFMVIGIYPAVSLPWKIIIIVPYAFIFASCAYYAYLTTKSDAEDTLFTKDGVDPSKVDNVKHCYVCRQDVTPTTMHCRLCRKCIDGFDHHCKWLNTCIGRKNYKIFYRTLSSATLLVTIEFVASVALFVSYFVSPNSLLANISQFYGSDASLSAWFGVLCGFCVLLGPVCGLLIQLWWFHVDLLRRQTTTYAYLTEKQREDLRKKRFLAAKKKKGKSNKNNAERGSVYPANTDAPESSMGLRTQKPVVYKRSMADAIFFCFGGDASNLDAPVKAFEVARIDSKDSVEGGRVEEVDVSVNNNAKANGDETRGAEATV
jgi:hypothetical protein